MNPVETEWFSLNDADKKVFIGFGLPKLVERNPITQMHFRGTSLFQNLSNPQIKVSDEECIRTILLDLGKAIYYFFISLFMMKFPSFSLSLKYPGPGKFAKTHFLFPYNA